MKLRVKAAVLAGASLWLCLVSVAAGGTGSEAVRPEIPFKTEDSVPYGLLLGSLLLAVAGAYGGAHFLKRRGVGGTTGRVQAIELSAFRRLSRNTVCYGIRYRGNHYLVVESQGKSELVTVGGTTDQRSNTTKSEQLA